MRLSLSFLFLSLLSISCNKWETDDRISALVTDYYLDFSIQDLEFGQNNDLIQLTCSQDQKYGTVIQNKENDFFIGFGRGIPEDSVLVNMGIRFTLEDTALFVHQAFDVEFLYVENRTHLEKISEDQFIYKSNHVLADILESKKWENDLWNSPDKSLMQFNIPNTKIYEGDVFEGMENEYVSNGFYYQHENFRLSEIEYLEKHDAILVTGQFDITLKVLSCGFWDLYNIKDARFHAFIE